MEQRQLGIQLLKAAECNDIPAMVTAIVQGADTNFADPETGMTALHWTAHNASRIGCAALLYGREKTIEDEGLESLIATFEDPEHARAALAASASQINQIAKDARGCFASAHVECTDVEKHKDELDLFIDLQRSEFLYTEKAGIPFVQQFPRGSIYSKIWVDPYFLDEGEEPAPSWPN